MSERNKTIVVVIACMTLSMVIVTTNIAMLYGLFSPAVDNKMIFGVIGPAYQNVVGAFVTLIGGLVGYIIGKDVSK